MTHQWVVRCDDGYEAISFKDRDRAEQWVVQLEADARANPRICQATHTVEERSKT